jgi:hypothetical protein
MLDVVVGKKTMPHITSYEENPIEKPMDRRKAIILGEPVMG